MLRLSLGLGAMRCVPGGLAIARYDGAVCVCQCIQAFRCFALRSLYHDATRTQRDRDLAMTGGSGGISRRTASVLSTVGRARKDSTDRLVCGRLLVPNCPPTLSVHGRDVYIARQTRARAIVEVPVLSVLLVLGMGPLLSVRSSLRVNPRWLGPPPSTGVLLLFLRLLSLASFQDL